MGKTWETITDRQSTADDARIQAQKDWAQRREEHFENPNPGLWDNVIRSLGNWKSNFNLEKAERNDKSWKHSKKDLEEGGYLTDSPIDKARFDVYNKILEAKQKGLEPDRQSQMEWNYIRQGGIPSHLIRK